MDWDELERCATLSDDNPLCIIYALTGWEWLLAVLFTLAIIAWVVAWRSKGK